MGQRNFQSSNFIQCAYRIFHSLNGALAKTIPRHMTLTPASLLAQIKCGREYSATQLAQHYAKSTEAVRDMLTTLVHQGRLRTCQRSWQTFYFSDTTAGSAMTGQDGVRSDVQTTKATPAARYTADGNLSGYEAQFALQRSLAFLSRGRTR